MKASFRLLEILAVSAASVAEAQNNSWISPNFGKWETNSNWSLGVAPASTHSVFITNFFSKTVTIDSITAGTGTMTASNLTVSAPAGSANTLFLNNSGLGTPLRILNRLSIGNNATLVVFSNSVVQVDRVTPTGTLTVDDGGFVNLFGGTLIATNGGVTAIGNTGTGVVTMTNSTFRTTNLGVAHGAGSQGTLTVNGLAEMRGDWWIGGSPTSTGTVLMTGGQLVANAFMHVGLIGVGQFTLSNGTVQAGTIFVGSFNAGAQGTLTMAGGTLNSGVGAVTANSALSLGDALNSTGTVWLTGGQLIATNPPAPPSPTSGGATVVVGRNGVGRLIVSNATAQVSSLALALNPGSAGTLTMAGGTLIAARLIATNAGGRISFTAGTITLNGAEVNNQQLFPVGAAGRIATLNLAGATNNLSSGLEVGPVANATGIVWVTGNRLVSTGESTIVGSAGVGQMTVSNGVNQIADWRVGETGGSQGTLTLAGGTNSATVEFVVADQSASTGTVWLTGGVLNAPTAMVLGFFGVARMTVSNGAWQALGVDVGFGAGSDGGLTVAGGTNVVSSLLRIGTQAGATGAVWLTGGRWITTNASFTVGNNGIGTMAVSNGVWLADVVGVAVPMFARGTLSIAGGTTTFLGGFDLGTNPSATGTLWMTGGELVATNSGEARIGSFGVGRLVVSNGTLRLGNAFLGRFAGGSGSLTVAGGTTTVSSGLTLGNFACTSTGIVTVTGGSLLVTNPAGNATLEVLSGTFTVSGGSVKLDKLVITNACGRFIRIGGALSATSTNLGASLDADGDGFTNQEELNAGTDPFSPASFPSPVTSWIDGTGKWEVNTNWSAGAPAIFNQAVFITNATTKTVTIDAITSGSFPGTMTISNLTVSSPPGTTNTLALVNSGTATPLRVLENSFIGNLTVSNGAFQSHELFIGNPGPVGGGTLTVAGGLVALPGSFNGMVVGSNGGTGAVWQTGGQIITTNTDISIGGLFSPARGQMTVSNGTLLAGNVFVGGQGGGTGSFTVAGGAVTIVRLVSVTSNSTVQFPGGVTTLRGADVSNKGQSGLTIGGAGQTAVLNLVGGTNTFAPFVSIPIDAAGTGIVWMTGGRLMTTNTGVSVGGVGVGQMTISNGTWGAVAVEVSSFAGSRGTLTIAGGTNTLSSFLGLGMEQTTATGVAWVTGGQLMADRILVGVVGVGQMTVSNGSVVAPRWFVSGRAGNLTVAGGVSEARSNLTVGVFANETGSVWVTGGQLLSTNPTGLATTIIGSNGIGQATVSNGLLRTGPMVVGFEPGARGSLTVAGGTVELAQFFSLGWLSNSFGSALISGGQLLTTNLFTGIGGNQGHGIAVVSNGTWRAQSLFIGNGLGSSGTLTVAGGTNTLTGVMSLADDNTASTGTVWVTGGLLQVTNDATTVGTFGAGRMTLSNGTFVASNITVAAGAGSRGTLTVAGGATIVLRGMGVGGNATATGTVWLLGGLLSLPTPVLGVTVGEDGPGNLTVSNGTLNTVALVIGLRNNGTVTVAGGTVSVPNASLTFGLFPNRTGTVWVTGGQFNAPLGGQVGTSGSGQLVVSNGIVNAGSIDVAFGAGARGTLTAAGGTSSFAGITIGNFACTATGLVSVTGGSLFVTNAAVNATLEVRSGTLTISGGLLRADKIVITNACARFVRTGGTLIYANTVLNPADDTDGDGFSNQTEQDAGSDPLDATSVPSSITSWIDGTGKWEVSTNWSGGVPAISHQAVFVTNAATKTVTIDAATPDGNLTTSNLTVRGAGAGINTLQLTNAGTTTPLRLLSGLNIGTNAFLVVTNSALQVDGRSSGVLVVDGSVTNLAGGRIIATNITVGNVTGGRGQFTALGGFLQASNGITLGAVAGAQGTLTVAGGTNEALRFVNIGLQQNATGAVWVTGGQLAVKDFISFANTIIGNLGVGQMTVSNGSFRSTHLQFGPNGGQGTLTIAGGTADLVGQLDVGNFPTSTGAVWVTGGLLMLTNGSLNIASAGNAQMSVSNGTVRAVSVAMAGRGTLTVAGGTLSDLNTFNISGAPSATATVWVTGGQVIVTNKFLALDPFFIVGRTGQGRLTVSNGLVVTHAIQLGVFEASQGTLTVAGGTTTATNLTVGVSDCTATGIVALTGGNLFVTNAALNATLEVQSGTFSISGGTAQVNRIVLTNACAHFARTGGTLIYGTAILNPADDTDGDGFTNQTEQNAGSDPLDANSVPAGQLGVTPATLNFGSIATGATAQASFVVTNTGAGVLNGTATALGGPFSIVSGSPFSLAANKSTNVVVQFAPLAAGSFTNAVVFNAGTGGVSTNTVIGTGAVAPVANFTATPTNGVVPLTVTFTNTSTGTITNNVWNFGDSVTSNTTATVLTHTYNAAGSFTVTLIALGPVGTSTNSKPNLIRALNPPQLNVSPASRNFGAVTVGQTNTLPFSVINTGDLALTGTVATASPFAIAGANSFNVAPGSTGTVQVSFIPTGAGTFSNNVVFTSNGGASTNAVTGTGVAPGNIGVNPASLDFGTIATGTTSQRVFVVSNTGGTTVTNGTATVGAPFAIVAGQQFSVPPFGSTNVTVQFAPVSAGAFTGQVVFATANGGSSTNPVTGAAAQPPVAGFSANPTNGAAPLLVFFTDESTGTITNRLWTFGDGATSGGTAPTHTYTTAGVFSVSLTVFGPTRSDTLNRPDLITVTNVAPMAGFSANPTNGAAPLLVFFTDESTGTITNRLWTFGDGGTSADTNPSHTYTNAGSFTVSLTVFGPTGSNTLSRPNLIVVEPAIPSADLELIKQGSDNFVLVGSNLTYTLTITNRGPDTATSVTVTDALPAGVTFVSASDDCTNVAGLVVCNLATLTSGQTTNLAIVVTATVEGLLTNLATVAAAEADPNTTNNTDTVVTTAFTVQPPPHDLAVVKLKAPKKIALSAKTPSKVGKFKVTIQNLGPQTETIPDLAALTALVSVEVESLGTNCASFAATLVPPNKAFPINVAPNKKLNLSYQATFDCANDPAATTKTAVHHDYRTMATVDLGALGETDTGASNDICPRPPSGSDPGCGNKTTTGALGGDVLTDVTVK